MQPAHIAFIAMLLTSGLASAAAVPQEVAGHIDHMKELCEESHGTPMPPAPLFLVSGHLTGGGQMDWAIDEAGFVCDGARGIFSGTGGAQIFIFAGIAGGKAHQVFEHGAYGMRIERRKGHDTLWLRVGGPLCGQPGNPSHGDSIGCERPLVWNKAKDSFEFGPLSRVKILSRPKYQ